MVDEIDRYARSAKMLGKDVLGANNHRCGAVAKIHLRGTRRPGLSQIRCGDEDAPALDRAPRGGAPDCGQTGRSEEHTSELQSLMRISYAVFCLKKKTKIKTTT